MLANWKNYIVPSILFPILFLLTVLKMGDYDIWFHMKAGQVIMETGTFIYKDIFTFTAVGQEWLYHEWLFGILAYNVYNIWGANGIILGKAILLTFTFVTIYKCMKNRGVSPHIASFILLLAVLAARFRLTERPHVFKFLFVAIFIYLLDLYRLKNKNHLWLLPIVQLLWVNIHGSFILGPILIFIYLISETVKKGKKQDHILVLITFMFFTSLTCLVNPYGLKLISFSLEFGENPVLSVINEWRPTRLVEFYGAFGLLFVMGIVSFLLKYRRLELVDVLLFGLFCYLSIKAIRFAALFSLSTAPIIATNLQYLSSKTTDTILKRWLTGVVSLAIIAPLSFYEVNKYPNPIFGLGQSQTIPQHAVDFLIKHELNGNMYNFHGFGGYLTWRLYPAKRVFVDGRPEIYDKDFQNSFIIGTSVRNWEKAVSVYNINYAIISYNESKVDRIASWISRDSNWELIYWDNLARIYARKTPQNQATINYYGHQVNDSAIYFNYKSLKEAINKGLSGKLEVELKNDIASNPENLIARHWLGMLYYETGMIDKAINIWEESIKFNPDAPVYNNIGRVFQDRGEHARAIGYFKKATAINKKLAIAYYNLGKSYEFLQQKEDAERAYKKFLKYAEPKDADIVRELKETHPKL